MANTGRLSKSAQKHIRDHAGRQSDKEMAKFLGKTEGAIRKYRTEKLGLGDDVGADKTDEIYILNELHADKLWPITKKRFANNDELMFFEIKWVNYNKQMGGDVWPTEKSQVEQMIFHEILLNRLMVQHADIRKNINQLQKLIDAESKKDLNDRNEDRIYKCISDRIAAEGLDSDTHKKINDAQQRLDVLSKSLKATRDQRVTTLKESGKGIMGLMQKLVDPVFREEEGFEMAIIAEAVKRERKRLAEYHEFADGEVDRPFLDSSTVREDDGI